MAGVFGLFAGVGVCFGVSVGGFLRADDDGRAGVDVGVLDLRAVRDVGLDGGCVEPDALRSLPLARCGTPLVYEDGGSLLVALVVGFVGAALTVFEGDLTTDGPDLTDGGETVDWGGVLGVSTNSGSTGFGGSGSTVVGFRDGGVTSMTLGISTMGEGNFSTSGGEASSDPLASGEVGLFFDSGNGEVWMGG